MGWRYQTTVIYIQNINKSKIDYFCHVYLKANQILLKTMEAIQNTVPRMIAGATNLPDQQRETNIGNN